MSIERTSIFRSLLSVVGGHLGNIMDSIARDTLLSEQQTALAENRLTLKRKQTYLKVLTRDYISVYCVDLLRDSIEILKLSPTANVDSILDRERSTDAGLPPYTPPVLPQLSLRQRGRGARMQALPREPDARAARP